VAQYDSADLLALTRTELRQPTTADFPATADIYAWLTQAQSDVFWRLAPIVPESQYNPPTLLTIQATRTVSSGTTSGSTTVTSAALFRFTDLGSTISGSGIPTGSIVTAVNSTSSLEISQAATATASPTLTFTPDPTVYYFGMDGETNPITPLGQVEIYRSLQGIMDSPSTPGPDFLCEGVRFRVPNGIPWAGPGPYARFITAPGTISASVAPTLRPVQAREALVYYAAARGWKVLGNAAEAGESKALYDSVLQRTILGLRTQYSAQDGIAGLNGLGTWVNNGGFGYNAPMSGS